MATQRNQARLWIAVLALAALVTGGLHAQSGVTADRLVNAAREPQNWLTYSGGYFSQRYSTLSQIDVTNVKNLELKWMYQGAVAGGWQTTPLVVDGVMYITQRPNDVLALDAKTGRAYWTYQHVPSPEARVCCGSNNRGLGILGNTLFLATLDGQLVALDATNGRPLWRVQVADPKAGYSYTLAPLVVKDAVIVGVGGGEYGIRGYITAHDAKTGKERWRFYTVPGPGEPGHETWRACPPNPSSFCDPDAWKHGGGSIWLTGSYDPVANLTYWGVGNAGPDWSADQRPGDNLYTDSVVALDADTGKLRWHYQFTPHDRYDYDAVQIAVLADINWNGGPVKAMLWANRNGNFYVLDRITGRFLMGKPFVKANWLRGFDEKGRPDQTPQPAGAPTWPGNQGGTNWYSPSFSPHTGLFYIPAWEDYATIFAGTPVEYREGQQFGGNASRPFVAVPGAPTVSNQRPSPVNNWTTAAGRGSVIAIDPETGARKWTYNMTDVTKAGILTTASDLLFTGSNEGHFQAIDARTGALLWKASLGGQIASGPVTFQVDGKQYVSVVSGLSLATFALRD